ncbi:predicted protein [Uncinocarpus reesii 1704]|uniref:Uncharacterized protein n=1 Tax=Uncinocarpus reesii (strain UAMH 1704) TaxID=336963 RepID=C4JJ17_UNCRE|nr:uncharacterized protein UREG_01624 [Uncinocarpus reesii 1704]EEP76775.1 predicted protein [Uncinocarpus reesii 1704]
MWTTTAAQHVPSLLYALTGGYNIISIKIVSSKSDFIPPPLPQMLVIVLSPARQALPSSSVSSLLLPEIGRNGELARGVSRDSPAILGIGLGMPDEQKKKKTAIRTALPRPTAWPDDPGPKGSALWPGCDSPSLMGHPSFFRCPVMSTPGLWNNPDIVRPLERVSLALTVWTSDPFNVICQHRDIQKGQSCLSQKDIKGTSIPRQRSLSLPSSTAKQSNSNPNTSTNTFNLLTFLRFQTTQSTCLPAPATAAPATATPALAPTAATKLTRGL